MERRRIALGVPGHLLIENRHGVIADAIATTADGTAEREAGLLMLHAQWQQAGRRRTVGADKVHDVRAFVDLSRANWGRPRM